MNPAAAAMVRDTGWPGWDWISGTCFEVEIFLLLIRACPGGFFFARPTPMSGNVMEV